MHVPDHLIDPQLELLAAAGAALAIASVAVDARRRPDRADRSGPTLLRSPERAAPQAATAALVFALQMVNVPVLSGTSGHLLGGALATALIGPRRALLAVASVVAVQALLFADGGVAAMGVNLWLIAILPVAVAALARRLFAVDVADGSRWWAAIGVGAAAAPLVSSAAFAGFFLGDSSAEPGRVAGAMIATHAAIAVAEVAITAAALGIVAWAQARRPATGTAPVWGLAGLSALGLSLAASTAPDGMERVLGDLEVAVDGPGSILAASPLADYAIGGSGALWSTSAAAFVGLLATCLLCLALDQAARSIQGVRGAPVAP